MQSASDQLTLSQVEQPRIVEIESTSKLVGRPMKRVEDPALLSGGDLFIDNLKFPNMVFAGFVRSPYAHARIKKIDLSNVQNDRSVVAIISPDEVRNKTRPIPVLWRVPGSKLHEHYALAQGKVLHTGDPVVAVAVESRDRLEDVIDSINVEYEILEPVLDPTTVDKKEPIHQELGTNTCFSVPMSSGDIVKAFEESDLIVSGRFVVSRLAACPMETRGVIANPAGLHSPLTVYSSTQWPHPLRTLLASCLKRTACE
jgi:carbon-monoxide dehydrogenase large subunit